MKQKLEVEVFSKSVNSPVIRFPGRRYPGVLIQGDSLSILFDLVVTIRDSIAHQNLEEADGSAQELQEILTEHLTIYEAALRTEGFDLPYSKDA